MPGEFESILTKLQGKLGKQTIKRASTINRPRPKFEVQQIKIFNEFNRRNPKADGGPMDDYKHYVLESELSKKVKELMDDGYDFSEAVREAMRQGYQEGGTAKQITFSIVEDFIRAKGRNPSAKELIKLTEKINDTIKETVDKKDFFKKKYNITLRGDETERELKYLTELLDDFEANLPNASPRDKLATYQFGKKRKLQSIARSYDKYGKEAIEEAARIRNIDLTKVGSDLRRSVERNVKSGKGTTSPVKTKTHIYPKGNRFGRYWSDIPGTNQTGISLKDSATKDEVLKLIKENPDLGKKDMIKAKLLTRNQADLFPPEVYGNPGKKTKVTNAGTKGSRVRQALTKRRSSPSMEIALRSPKIPGSTKQIQLGHAGQKETPTSLKNLIYKDASANRRMTKVFEQPLNEAIEKFKTIYNSNAAPNIKRQAALDLQKFDRSLRKKYPEFSKLKTRLNIRPTNLDEAGIMVREILPDPSLAISQEAGTTLKGVTAKSEKGQDLLRLGQEALEKAKGSLKKSVSSLKGSQLGSVCSVLNKAIPMAKGGRVGFASGGTMANCLRLIDENPAAAVRAISSISKSGGKLKNVVNLARTIGKGVGYGVLAELAFATPFAIADLRAGESGKRILGNATMGLIGDTVADEQKEFMGEKGYRAYELMKANDAYNALGLASEESFSPDDDMLISERITQADNTLNKKLEPYIMEDGTFNETQFNQDYGIAQAGLKNIEDVKKMRRDRIQEGIRNRVDPYANDFMAATGGLATLPRKVAKPTNYGIVGTKVYNN